MNTTNMNDTQDDMADRLCALYAEREILETRFPGMSVADIVEAATGARPAEPVLPDLESLDSLEAQLIELYADRELLAQAFPGMGVEDIAHDFAPAARKTAA